MGDIGDENKPGFVLIWTIENIYPCADSRAVESPIFLVRTLENTRWQLSFLMDCNNKAFFLRLHRFEGGPKFIEIDAVWAIPSSDSPSSMEFAKAKRWGVGDVNKDGYIHEELDAEGLHRYLTSDGTLKIRFQMWNSNQERTEQELSFARTRIGFDQRCFIWSEQAFNRAKGGEKRTLMWQPSSKYPIFIFSLCLPSEKDSEKVCIETVFEDPKSAVLLILCIEILDATGKVVHTEKKQEHWFCKNNQSWKFPLSLKKSDLLDEKKGYLAEGTLNLKLNCFVHSGVIDSQLENYRKFHFPGKAESVIFGKDHLGPDGADGKSVCFCNWQKDIKSLYDDESLCDVNLLVDTMSFPAHKAILGLRSEVFKTMFMTDMQEASRNVKIPDLDAVTVRRMLEFVYTGTVEDLNEEVAKQLYYAADEYKMKSLKQICSQFFKSILDVTNACEMLILADKHSDVELKGSVQLFIMKHDTQIMDSKAWKDLKKNKRFLAFETMESLYKNIRTNSVSTVDVS